MSFITGKPFVESVLSGLNESELKRLQTLINNSGAAPVGSYRTYYVGTVKPDLLTTIIANNGYFVFINLSYEAVSQAYHTGILCRVDNEFAFFDWTPKSKVMNELKIYQTYFEPVNEQLTTEEFRRVLGDIIVNGSDGNPVQIKEVVSLPLTGEEDTIYLTDSNAQTEGEPVVIPNPTAQDNGKALMVNNGAYDLGTISGGTKLYRHHFSITTGAGGVSVYIIATFSQPATRWINSSGPGRLVFGDGVPNINDKFIAVEPVGNEFLIFPYGFFASDSHGIPNNDLILNFYSIDDLTEPSSVNVQDVDDTVTEL